MNLTSLIPLPYRILALLALAASLVALGYSQGASKEKTRQSVREAAIVAAFNQSILARVAENDRLAKVQAAANLTINKVKDEELTSVRAVIAAAPRLRIGAALCPKSAPTSDAQSAGRGDGDDSPGRLVRDDADRDIRALKLAVENDLATGRACQAFLTANDLMP